MLRTLHVEIITDIVLPAESFLTHKVIPIPKTLYVRQHDPLRFIGKETEAQSCKVFMCSRFRGHYVAKTRCELSSSPLCRAVPLGGICTSIRIHVFRESYRIQTGDEIFERWEHWGPARVPRKNKHRSNPWITPTWK